ncbi:MAG: hypothetical protein ACT4TC_23445 [Myxococcaceae bacterium]
MTLDEKQAIELYRIHTEELRFQVQLNWDRAKSSLTFHVALVALTAGLANSAFKVYAPFLFGFIALSALISTRIMAIGHSYYRVARDHRRQIETLNALKFLPATTPGQRGEKRRLITIHNLLMGIHLLIALLALAGAWVYASAR